MSKKSKSPPSKRGAAASEEPPVQLASPFASLAKLRDQLPPGDVTTAEETAAGRAVAAARAAPVGPARAVVRYERKGRGGKEMTLVEKLALSADELETWCRELKRALGCGGAVEADTIALAGDQRKRLPALLEARGVRRISVG